MPNPMKNPAPLAAGLALGTWFPSGRSAPSPYPLPAPARPASAGRWSSSNGSMRSRIGCAGTLPPTSPMSSRPPDFHLRLCGDHPGGW